MLLNGADVLLQQSARLRGRHYGLLCHQASVTAELQPIHHALADLDGAAPEVLLAPEHGFYGVEQDMVPARDARDPGSGLPIVSLYGSSAESLRPVSEVFSGLDLLIVDLQDVGVRYYTFAATAVWAAEVALEEGVEVWLLDRPNPLGGSHVEGNLPQARFESFVSAFRIPVRHGLTLGELLLLEARRRGWPDGLEVWPMRGWRREMRWEATGRPWIAPSPNMPTAATAEVYPGACLVEATELSEGRGTTRPFQLLGAPGLDPEALVTQLKGCDLAGVTLVPTYFRPQFQKHAGALCGGVEVVVTDPAVFQGFRFGLEFLASVRHVAPECFDWRRDPYEFVADRPAIDLLTGDDRFRCGLEGEGDWREWAASFSSDEAAFRDETADILLYPAAEGG